MRFSVWPNLANPWSEVVATVNHAEATGWDGVYVADHFMGDNEKAGGKVSPTFEATAAMAGLATVTARVRLGSLVFGITYRHPAVLANWAKTVDHMSAGRLNEAVAGWQEVGVDEVIVPDFTLGSGAQKLEAFDLIIEEVAPAFR